MSILTTIEAEVGHLEGEVKTAFENALESFKAEMLRLGITHAVTPATPAPVVTDGGLSTAKPEVGNSGTTAKGGQGGGHQP